MPSMGLLVLHTSTLENTLAFYRAFGLMSVQEQHGTGPIHYSTTLELYPAETNQPLDRKPGGATMIGIKVESVDAVIETLDTLGIQPLSPAKDSAWGRRATVIDPDGRLIELTEAK